MRFLKYLILLASFPIWGEVSAQSLVGLHPELQWLYSRKAYSDKEFHTLIQPWYKSELGEKEQEGFQYFLNPLLNVQLSAGSPFRQSYGAGVYAGFSLGKTLFVDLNYSLNARQFMPYDQAYIDSVGLIPHYDRYIADGGSFYLYQSLNFNISWTPIKYITIRAGKDRRFWGDGYRSLFLSDNANSYPFLQTIFNFWHVKYVFMTSRMTDYQLDENFEHRHHKYTSMHCLSWNVTPDINLNLFETIIWDAVDSISRRTFDINYLNPVIFFRPVEYSIGSPDNVLIGFGGKARIWKENYLYAQFVLDEFKLSEIKARNGWWANKYAFQAGLRSFWGTLRQLMIQAEFNQIRPFNYTHYYPLQNYGHLVEPLAHPLGANLIEGILIGRYAISPRWSAHAIFSYAVQGTDTIGKNNNYGSNIYKSNTTRSKDYGNTMLQGIRTVYSYQELKLAYTLVQKWNLQAELTLSNRLFIRDEKTQNDLFLNIGLKTLLYRD